MNVLYVFADCELDTQLYVLRRADRVIGLRPKVFQVLLYLLEHRHQVVAKDALLEAVWPEQYISEATLADVIRSIRQAVGDEARHPRVVQTRHGHGYRFVAEVATAPLPAPEIPVSDALAPPLPEQLQQAPGERKVATICCVTLGQNAALLEQLGLDALHTLLHARYALVKEVVQQYEGTVQPLLGDRVLAVFGVPLTQEDHAQRAGLAALAMRERLEAHRRTYAVGCHAALAIRLGLHTGWVAVGGTDATPESPPMVIGDAVALAITLQEHAEPGTILCSEATAQRLQEVALVEKPLPLSLPDHPDPVVASTLVSARHQSSPHDRQRLLSPFVGRAQELATLQALLAQAQEGQGHVVGIVGEPGIGKSRLLAEFRRSVRSSPLTYLESQCWSYGTASPYLPVRQLLQQMCAIAEADPPEAVATKVCQRFQEVQLPAETWAPLVLHLLGRPSPTFPMPALDPQAYKERTFTALLQLCMSLSQQRPLVLEIENLHWIDATSEEWLAALVEHVPGRPMLVLGSFRPGYRPAWLGASSVTQISLTPLGARESLQVLRAVPQGAQLPEPLVQELLTTADGNPFFVEELTRAVVEHDPDQMPDIPDTVQAVLAARIDRLPPAEKRLLQMAAVIGKEVSLPLLEGVADLPATVLHQGLHHLQTAGFLSETHLLPPRTYTFKHALTREVAYQSLLENTRQPYHYQIAQLLSKCFSGIVAGQPELVAHHYTEAGHFEEALPYWQRAGEQAAARSANIEAICHCTKGLELLKHLPVTTEHKQHELRLQLTLSAPLYMVKGLAPEVEQTYQRVLELCRELQDDIRYFFGLAGLCRFLCNQGQLQKAHKLGQQCLHLVNQTQDSSLLAETHLILGSTCLFMGELPTARSHFQQGASLSDTHRAHARGVHQVVDPGVMCLCREALALWVLGYADQALLPLNQALTLAKTTGHAFDMAASLCYTAVVHAYRREFDAAHEYAEATIVFARGQKLAFFEPPALCFQGWALATQGAPELGLAKFREGLTAWQARGITAYLSPSYVILADIYHQYGQIEAGLQALDEALRIVHARMERLFEAEIYRLRGELLLHPALLDTKQAETCLQRACTIAASQHAKAWELRSVMSLSRLWHQQGKSLAARQKLAQIYGWFTEGFATPDLLEARALLDVLVR
jgi:class 3 adenylate cyclase/tetratricopeptide (TPR) repeat protein